jgi:tetratricopeptide (TPR) repeat protein
LEAALRRKLGDLDKARAAAAEALALDPLDFWGWNETALLRGGAGSDEGKAVIKRLDVLMRDAPAAYLELAADYARVGLWDEGLDVLERLIALNRKGSSDFPLVHYWLAWFLHQKGDDARAEARLKAASAAPADYGFPFQLEMADILRWARTVNPADARAPYYLGNLLFDLQPEAALASWERAAALDPKFPTAHRNLGLAYARIRNDLARSVKEYEAAVANAPEDAKLYEELDRMYEAAGAPPAKRLALLEKNHKVLIKRDDALTREIKLLVQAGRYDGAIEIIEGRHFHVWEGGGEIHGIFVEAHLLRGEKFLEEGRWREALRDFDTAATYPANLETAVPAGGGGSAEISYFAGLALEGLRQTGPAREAFEKAASYKHPSSEPAYFEALALRKLGRGGEADEKLRALRTSAEERLKFAPAMDFFEKFGEKQSAAARNAQAHYLWGLAALGLNEAAEAAAQFHAALAADANFSAAARALARLK